MTDGLISSYTGRMILCGILAFIGLAASTALTLATHVRKGLPLTTQIDRVTGVKEHGVGRWFITFAAFLAGPWLLLMFAMTGTHYVVMLWHWTTHNWWVLALPAVALLLVAAFWYLIRRDAATERQDRAQLAALPASVPAPTVAAQPLWSAPVVEGNWSDRA